MDLLISRSLLLRRASSPSPFRGTPPPSQRVLAATTERPADPPRQLIVRRPTRTMRHWQRPPEGCKAFPPRIVDASVLERVARVLTSARIPQPPAGPAGP